MPSSNNNNHYDDGSLARALQKECEKEYRRRGLEQHLKGGSAPSLDFPPPNGVSAPTEIFAPPFYADNRIDPEQPSYTTPYMTQTTSRPAQKPPRQPRTSREPRERNSRLEPPRAKVQRRQERPKPADVEQARQHRNARAGTTSQDPRKEQPQHHSTGMNQKAEAAPMQASDEEIAHRLEQELRDEEIARQFVVQEQVQRSAAESKHPRSCCRKFCFGMRRCFSCVLGTVLIAVAVVVVLYFSGVLRGVPSFIPTPESFREEDPFNNADPSQANLWRTKGGRGLSLNVINALDSNWENFFYTAVDQWDSGSPDTLRLSITQSYPEKTCSTVDERVKVCNGDYGATNWRGINKVLLHDDLIYASAARMNDYYVRDTDVQQKQYTMCHELGHAWGLPHTDSNFNNRDLRNCMDYTNNPGNNMQPDTPNFEFLAQLYGTLDGSYELSSTGIYVTSRDAIPGNRQLESVPSSILKRVDEVDSLIDQGLITDETKGWRQLHSTEKGKAIKYNLGDGFSLQIHMLLV